MEKKGGQIPLSIGGMTCVNCQTTIEKALKHTEGVLDASVRYRNGSAEIVCDAEQISVQDMASVIEKLDYAVAIRGP